MRIRVMVVALGLLMGSAAVGSAQPSAAASKPLRTGTIEGGTGVTTVPEPPRGNRWGCEYAVDCQTWLQSGCSPALTGRDPVLTASIVDVRALADGRSRRSFSWDVPASVHPGVMLQFWRQDCTEIPDAEWHSVGRSSTCESRPGWPDPNYRCKALRIPRGATWMTVSTYWTTAHLTWTLT
jgi:hypothetical protein